MSSTLRWALAALTLAAAMVAGGQFMEQVLGLEPCPLCLMQRLWAMLAGSFVLAGLSHDPRLTRYPAFALSCAAVGAGFSIRQLWLQSLPADAVPSCGPDMAYMIEALPMSEIIKAMTMGTGNCAKVDWSLFGVSIAGWALLAFAGLAALIILWMRAQRRG